MLVPGGKWYIYTGGHGLASLVSITDVWHTEPLHNAYVEKNYNVYKVLLIYILQYFL